MVIKSNKAGAILGLIGSTLLLIAGLAVLAMSRTAYHPDPNFPLILPYITSLTTIALSACGLAGTILAFRDVNWGNILILCAGMVGIIGSFLPIYIYENSGYYYFQYLVSTLLYADLVLMIVGGILGLSLAPKKKPR